MGTTSNDVYLTLAPPLGPRGETFDRDLHTVYHTFVYLGSHFGSGAQDRDTLVANVWTHFASNTVDTVNESNLIPSGRSPGRLKYWENWNLKTIDAVALIAHRDGSCGPWYDLLRQTFFVQGVANVKSVEVRPYLGNERIVIKKWIPTTLPVGATAKIKFDANADAAGHNAAGNGYAFASDTELIDDLSGVEGQGINTNPMSIFLNHVFLQYQKLDGTFRWLDPSYGKEYLGATIDDKERDFEKLLYGIGTPPIDKSYHGYDVKFHNEGDDSVYYTIRGLDP